MVAVHIVYTSRNIISIVNIIILKEKTYRDALGDANASRAPVTAAVAAVSVVVRHGIGALIVVVVVVVGTSCLYT